MTKSFEKYIDEHPLVTFSLVSQMHAEYLKDMSEMIDKKIECSFKDSNSIDCIEFKKATGYFWFWILGLFELLRTLGQYSNRLNKTLFDDNTKKEIIKFKNYISKIRAPFAKQEKAGEKNVLFFTPNYVSGIDFDKKDIIFNVENDKYSYKEISSRFNDFIYNIKISREESN